LVVWMAKDASNNRWKSFIELFYYW
jgi:hypothetical protein